MPANGLEDKIPFKFFDASDVEKHRRMEYFQYGICQAFLSLTVDKAANTEIDAQIKTLELNNGTYGTLCANKNIALRNKLNLRKIDDELFVITKIKNGYMKLVIDDESFYRESNILYVDYANQHLRVIVEKSIEITNFSINNRFFRKILRFEVDKNMIHSSKIVYRGEYRLV